MSGPSPRGADRRPARALLAPALAVALAALVLAPAAAADQGDSKHRRLAAGSLAAGYKFTCALLGGGTVKCWGENTFGELGQGNVTVIGDNETPAALPAVDLGAGRTARAISSGANHSCAILDTRAVRCWGYGANGRLGYGDTEHVGDNETPGSVGPVAIGAGRTARAIAAGDGHTCAILDNGRVRCWGWGMSGELGYGSTDVIGDDELPDSVGPVYLGPGRTAVAIAVGDGHTCVILDNGKVRCWGSNAQGQLGTGVPGTVGDDETPGSIPPVNLGPNRRAVAITAGNDYTCAILDTGALRCWGNGADGRTGQGNTATVGDDETPAAVPPVFLGAGRTAVAVNAGFYHTCAVLDTGAVRCWGDGSYGKLGRANTATIGDDETPGSVPAIDIGYRQTAVAVSASDSFHSCVVLRSGNVRCFGRSDLGQLGYGNTSSIGDDETPGSAGPVAMGGLVQTTRTPGLSLARSPRRDRSFPYRVVASGALTGFLADAGTCSGPVTVRAKRAGGKAVVKKAPARMRAGVCRYTAPFKLRLGRWTLRATFPGNGSLTGAESVKRTFRAG